MWKYREVKESSWKAIFVQGFLGEDGHLTRAFNELENLQAQGTPEAGKSLGDFQIFGAQMAVSKSDQNVHAPFDHAKLVLRVADELIMMSGIKLANLDLSVEIFTLQGAPQLTNKPRAQWKIAMVQEKRQCGTPEESTVKLGLRGLDQEGLPPGGKIGEVQMQQGVSYFHDGLPYGFGVAFKKGVPSSSDDFKSTMSRKYEKKEPKSITWADLDIWGSKYSQNSRELSLSGLKGGCEQVLWSPDGALLSFMAEERVGTLVTLTSEGAIMCYFTLWERGAKNDDNTQALFSPFHDTLNYQWLQSKKRPITIFGTRIGFFSESTKPAAALLDSIKEITKELTETIEEGRQIGKFTEDSVSSAEELLTRGGEVKSGWAPDSGGAWNAIYQEAEKENSSPQTVLIMSMLRKEKLLPGGATFF